MAGARGWIWVAFGVALVSGCAREAMQPDLARIYTDVVVEEGRRPLITVPGTVGSRLVDSVTGTVIWGGGSRGLSADPEDPAELALIALPILPADRPLSEIRDTIVPDGVLDSTEARVLGVPVAIEVYGGVRRVLQAGGFRPQGGTDDKIGIGPGREESGETGKSGARAPAAPRRAPQSDNFGFSYDWRRDIVASAQAFDQFVRDRQREVAAERTRVTGRRVDPGTVTFDLLAHSMGGLVTRYYLMYGAADLPEDGSLPPITWAGARAFNRVVFVAPPNAGSIIAMDNLINGKELGPFQPFYPPAMLSTHPSVWQLMPRSRHNRVHWDSLGDLVVPDLYDPVLWDRAGWALAGPDADRVLEVLLPDEPDPAKRRAMALAHQARLIARAAQFQKAMDRWSPPPAWLDLFLVVGGGFQTPASATVSRVTGEFKIASVEEGDGVVLRASALLDERQGGAGAPGLKSPLRFHTTLFLPDEHVRLTQNPVFGDNLLYWLLEQPRPAADLVAPDVPLALSAAGPDHKGAPEPGAEPKFATPGNDR